MTTKIASTASMIKDGWKRTTINGVKCLRYGAGSGYKNRDSYSFTMFCVEGRNGVSKANLKKITKKLGLPYKLHYAGNPEVITAIEY